MLENMISFSFQIKNIYPNFFFIFIVIIPQAKKKSIFAIFDLSNRTKAFRSIWQSIRVKSRNKHLDSKPYLWKKKLRFVRVAQTEEMSPKENRGIE